MVLQSSSSASPIASTSQQGETNSPNVSLSPPLAGPSLSQIEMRQRIIEILSGTANDCLQELGYHPTMPARLQELELRNKKWQNENMGLYQDNKRLLETVNAHSESMQLLHQPESEKIRHIQKLEVENRALRIQMEQMKMKHGSDGNEQRYNHLHKEYSALKELYSRTYGEVVRLREIVGFVDQPHQHQHQDAFHILQPQIHNAQLSRNIPLPQPSFIQNQLPPGTNLRSVQVQGQHTFVSSPSAVYVPGQQQTQRNAGQMVYSTDTQRRHTISTNQNPRAMQGNDMVSTTQMQMMQMMQQQQQQQQQRISCSSPMHGQIPMSVGHMTSQAPHESIVEQPRHVRRASYPVLPPEHQFNPSNSNQQSSLQSTSGQVTTRNLSSPLTTQSFHSNPTLPLSAPPSTVSHQQSYFDSSKLNTLVSSTSSMGGPSPNSARAPGPKTLSTMSPPNSNIPTPPPSLASSQQNPDVRRMPQVEPTNTQTATQFTAYRSGTVTSGAGSASPHPSSGHLKRESMSADLSDDARSPNKKPKLEALDTNMETPTPPVSRTPSAPPMSSASETSGAPQNLEAPGQMVEEEDDDEEEIIQVGPDGLRLVEDILEQVYGENRRGEVVCWFCKNRFEKGFTTTPPKPFVGATDQVLEAHCKKDHEVAWNQARTSI